MLLMQAQENGVVLDEEQLLFIAGGQDRTFDDDAPTAHIMFMANLSSADLIYDEAGPSYDSDILSEYVKNNAKQVVQCNVSSVPNDALMMIVYDMHEHAAQCIFANELNKVVNESLTAKLARYKEQVEIYEKGKEHFEGIQMALIKEVKEIKEIFEQMEAEVEQHAVDKKCAEIERKNLLIENENLLADCLSNELLYSVMNAVNIVSGFSKMHDAYTVEQARTVELEAKISKLKHKIQNDDHSEMIKCFSNLQTSRDAPEFDSFFEINKMKEQLQGKDNTIRKLKVQISHMNERRSEADCILDFKALDSQNIELTEHVTALQEQNKRFRTSSLLTENDKLMAQLKGKMKCYEYCKTKSSCPCSTKASGLKPKSNTKNNMILPAKSDNKKKVEDHPKISKSKLKEENRVDSSISSKRTVWKVTGKLFANVGYQWKPTGNKFTLGCSKHMTRNHSRLKNFVKKFIGTVRFRNDRFCAIIGYEDYVIGDNVISRVYYVEGLGHNLFFIGQICNLDLEIAFRKYSCYVRDVDGV
uniref:Integrase, catalytic region, zinc finger, CCHC-type, peptidase aspartic, catalytic n=1 Tax=Tanacetum cinerariifolium TaxID=118510 RepID=A0A6L2NFM1_TANCI|nr:integrase, catalytic region, zinc finger, CCHC-type, peptidase aspartic, catalytic [Tanacetum cinerariifolium]